MPSIQVIGHRGITKLAPENTIESFEKAIELGVNGVECDVQRTSDQKLVVIHDATVNRTTNGVGTISKMQSTEVLKLNAGEGQKIPTLEQVLDTIKGRCELICELKGTGTDTAVGIVAEHGLLGQVTFISSSMSRLYTVLTKFPSAQISPILSKTSEIDGAIIKSIGAKSLDICYRIVTEQLVNQIQSAGLVLRVWTPTNILDFRKLMKIGVDAITTDRADLLLNFLKTHAEN